MASNYYQQQQGRRPTPYEQRDSYSSYGQGRRPADPPPPFQSQSDPYASAFEQLQSHRPAGMYYPEAHGTEPKPAKSPDIVSPRPHRLNPSMPANLAQNLDKQTSKSRTPQPAKNPYDAQYEARTQVPSQPPQLPPLEPSTGPKRKSTDDSLAGSLYSIPSGVDEYLKSDFPPPNQVSRPVQPSPQPPRQNPYDTAAAQPSRPDPYSQYTSQQSPKLDPYSAYAPQQTISLSAPYTQPGRPRSSSGKSQYPPQPPPVNYSNRPTSSGGPSTGQSPPQQTSTSRPRINSGGSQDRYSYNQPQSSHVQQRPFSQDMSRPLPNNAETTPRNSLVLQSPPQPDFIDMPEAGVANLSLDDTLPSRQGEEVPLRSSPPLAASTGLSNVQRASPPMSLKEEDDWLISLERDRENAIRTSNPEVALSWAEQVHMYVSISLDEYRRDQEEPRPSTPPREKQLWSDCVAIVEKFVKARHPKAVYMRGMWFEYGDFKYPVDRHEAYKSYEAAAKMGYARAEYRIGKMYEDVNDLKRGIKHYERGAQLEDSASLYRMGMLKLLGQKGYPVDLQGGINFIFRSAVKADLDAPQGAYIFALLLAGEFEAASIPEALLPCDHKSALRMLEKAASLGFSHAQQKLGSAYEHGTWGCGYDPQLSLHYYTLAAKQGDAEAMMGMSKWYLCGGEGFSQNEELAFKYGDRAAKLGLPQAEFAMGYFYEVGVYVQPDLRVAETWYKRAAEHGNREAIQRREGISRNKTLSRRDHESITGSIRASRLKKGQKASGAPVVPVLPEQYNEAFRPQAPYAAEPTGRTQSPGGRQQKRFSSSGLPTAPQVHGRTNSGSQPKPDKPPNSRHSSYGTYAQEHNPDSRKSSYGQYPAPSLPANQGSSQPSLASLANAPDGHSSYSPPIRPQTGSRPASQGSLASLGSLPPTSTPVARPDTYGSGPKTFQEMGVDTRYKKDSDCVIM